jgi:hypothetical protein
MTLRAGLALSRDAAVWGGRLYARHFLLIFGLSLIPTVQRFVAVRWGAELPGAVNVTAEVLTGATRLVLLYVILRLAVRSEPELRGLTLQALWQRLGAGIDRGRLGFAVQFAVLGVAFVLLDVLPGLAIAQWVAEERRELVTAVLVSVKNPTVIAFTFIWMTGVGRRLMLDGRPRAERPVEA